MGYIQRQLDEAVDQSYQCPKKLVRNLMSVFFTPTIMAMSSCGGTRRFPSLNKDIVGACIRKSNIQRFQHNHLCR